MSREEVLNKLKELGLDGKIKKENNQTVISVEERSNSEPIDITPISSEDSKEQEKI